jgi:exodeoxyribonuclease VIII
MTKNFVPGFYENVPFSDYLADPAVNNSGLKIFSQSPAKFRFWQNHERPGTPAQVEGSALHTLTPGQWGNIYGMSEAFEHTSCSIAQELLTEGIPEMSIFWDDPETGLRCKIRPDWLRNDDIIIDLKSTQAGSPKGFLREVKRWGYDRQAAWYERGLNAAYCAAGVDRQVEAFLFIVVENFSPYETAIYMLSGEMIETARQQIDTDLERYAECLSSGIYPGYPNQIIVLGEQEYA